MRGFRQRPEVDFNKTIAPNAKHDHLCVFLTIIPCYMLYTMQLDVKTALLYAEERRG